MAEDEKLQKVLARAGLGSRREMERAIAQGEVLVNGQVANLGDRVTAQDKLQFRGKKVNEQNESERQRVLLYKQTRGRNMLSFRPGGSSYRL